MAEEYCLQIDSETIKVLQQLLSDKRIRLESGGHRTEWNDDRQTTPEKRNKAQPSTGERLSQEEISLVTDVVQHILAGVSPGPATPSNKAPEWSAASPVTPLDKLITPKSEQKQHAAVRPQQAKLRPSVMRSLHQALEADGAPATSADSSAGNLSALELMAESEIAQLLAADHELEELIATEQALELELLNLDQELVEKFASAQHGSSQHRTPSAPSAAKDTVAQNTEPTTGSQSLWVQAPETPRPTPVSSSQLPRAAASSPMRSHFSLTEYMAGPQHQDPLQPAPPRGPSLVATSRPKQLLAQAATSPAPSSPRAAGSNTNPQPPRPANMPRPESTSSRQSADRSPASPVMSHQAASQASTHSTLATGSPPAYPPAMSEPSLESHSSMDARQSSASQPIPPAAAANGPPPSDSPSESCFSIASILSDQEPPTRPTAPDSPPPPPSQALQYPQRWDPHHQAGQPRDGQQQQRPSSGPTELQQEQPLAAAWQVSQSRDGPALPRVAMLAASRPMAGRPGSAPKEVRASRAQSAGSDARWRRVSDSEGERRLSQLYERTVEWKRRSWVRCEQARHAQAYKGLEECSFRPTIDPLSKRIAEHSPSRQRWMVEEAADAEALFAASWPRAAPSASQSPRPQSGRPLSASVSALRSPGSEIHASVAFARDPPISSEPPTVAVGRRLYRQAQDLQRRQDERVRAVAQAERAMSNWVAPSTPRHRSVSPRVFEARGSSPSRHRTHGVPPELAECTFTPQTNPRPTYSHFLPRGRQTMEAEEGPADYDLDQHWANMSSTGHRSYPSQSMDAAPATPDTHSLHPVRRMDSHPLPDVSQLDDEDEPTEPHAAHTTHHQLPPRSAQVSRTQAAPPLRQVVGDEAFGADGEGEGEGEGPAPPQRAARSRSASRIVLRPQLDWQEFMDRQSSFLEEKQQRIRSQLEAPPPKVAMSPGSQRILARKSAQQGSQADGERPLSVDLLTTPGAANRFLRHLQQLVEKGNYEVEQLTRASRDGAVSATARASSFTPPRKFHPQISRRAASKPPRPLEEMSRGDMERQHAWREQQRILKELQELAGAPFTPFLPTKRAYPKVKPKLNMAEPSRVLEEAAAKQQAMEEYRQALKAQREAEEMSQCTFTPEVHPLPEYIQRIAGGYYARQAEDLIPDARFSYQALYTA